MNKLVVKCVGCGVKKDFDHIPHDMPFCEHCGSPMIAERAEVGTTDKKRSLMVEDCWCNYSKGEWDEKD